MEKIEKAFTVKDVVKHYLTRYPKTRDCDSLLCATIWDYERQKKNISKDHFLDKYAAGIFTNSETIRRWRQRLQEKNIELRGERYGIRKGALEQNKRKELKE